MAIGVSGGNNPFDLRKLNNAGVAQNNQTGEVSSTETETPVDTASKLSGVAGRLRAQISGPDGFGKVDPNKLIIAGLDVASPSSSIKFNGNITATSAPRQPSLVEAIKDFSEIAAGGNPEITFGNQQLLLAAKMSQAAGISGDFQVSEESANLKRDNELLALVGNA